MNAQEKMIASLVRNRKGCLEVTFEGEGEPVEDVRVVRCFPRSFPEGHVAICSKEGKELVLLESLDGLSSDVRDLIEEELHDKIFCPRIQRVISNHREFGITSIRAETDRGLVTFQIRSRDDVEILSPTQLVFRDSAGNMYEVEDVTELDHDSREALREYV